MINLFYELEFELKFELETKFWLNRVAESEQRNVEEINYIFCDDEYLLKINQQYLNHDTYTDIISFDNSEADKLAGDIFISVEQIKENAKQYTVAFEEELRRVMAHGILHFCGYKDKSDSEVKTMRQKEDEKLKMFHVEQ